MFFITFSRGASFADKVTFWEKLLAPTCMQIVNNKKAVNFITRIPWSGIMVNTSLGQIKRTFKCITLRCWVNDYISVHEIVLKRQPVYRPAVFQPPFAIPSVNITIFYI